MQKSIGGVASALVLALPQFAHAQVASSGPVVEELVVTAQRREERLQDVPLAVSAMAGPALERAGVTNTTQLSQVMPGLTAARNTVAFTPFIRGVGTRSGADESNVAVYIDGVYQPMQTSLGFDLLNVERVEVLRGPQGTLFGRNATGGLINVITSDPPQEFSGKAVVRLGNYGSRSGQLYVGGPLLDQVRASVAYARIIDDGYIKDLIRGGHSNDRDSEVIRGKVLVEPTDNFRAIVVGTYAFTRDPTNLNNQPLNGNTQANQFTPRPIYGVNPWESATGPQTAGRNFQRDLNLFTTNRFSGFNIETTSSLQRGGALVVTDNDASPLPLGGSNVKQRQRYLSSEIRALSTTSGPLSWIGGIYYFEGYLALHPLVSITNGVAGLPIFTHQDIESRSAFGEATLALSDSIRVIGGVRYTDEDRSYFAQNTATILVPKQNGSFDKITYRGTVQYNPTSELNVYATYSRGFKSGVFNVFALNLAAAQPVRPEVLDALEFGIKAEPARWLRTNLSAFHYDYTDIQQTARTGALVVLLNAAKSKLNGIEAEVVARPTTSLNVRAFATYLDAKYDEFPTAQVFQLRKTLPAGGAPPGQAGMFCPAGVVAPCGNVAVSPYDASGKQMIRAPEWTAGFSFDYAHPTEVGEFGVSANLFWSAKSYWDFENRIAQPSYVQVNGELWWTSPDKSLRVGVYGRNLANEVVLNQVLTSAFGDVAVQEQPRSYGISISKGF